MNRTSAAKTTLNGQQGFTLIELMVSMALLALILGVLGASVRSLSFGSDRLSEKISRQEMLLRGFGLLRRDIESMQRLIGETGGTPHFLFHGTKTKMQFVVIEPSFPARSGPYLIRYDVKGNGAQKKLIRSRAVYHPDLESFDPRGGSSDVALMAGPYVYRFAYGELRKGKVTWSKTWSDRTRLPNLIQFNISALGGQQLPAIKFVIRVRINAERSCINKKAKDCTIRTKGILRAVKDDGPIKTSESL